MFRDAGARAVRVPGKQASPSAPGSDGRPPGRWEPEGWEPARWERVWPGATPGVPVPEPGECHLWPVPLLPASPDQSPWQAPQDWLAHHASQEWQAHQASRDWLAWLEPADRERANRYRVEHAWRTFVTSRAVQRAVAACYFGGSPATIHVDRQCRRCGVADHGRPRVRNAGELDVSVTHAGDWVVVAVVGSGAVGVDLEAGRRTTDNLDDLAGAVLSPAELATFDARTADARPGWFHRCWTRKEATVKLTGHGLEVPLRQVDVHADQAVVEPAPADWPTAPIHLSDLPAPDGYTAALATTVPLTRARFFTLAPPTK